MRSRPWPLANLALFLCLSSMFLVYPHLSQVGFGRFLLDAIFSVSIFSAIYAQSKLSLMVRVPFAILGVMSIASTWLPLNSSAHSLVTPLLYCGFFGMSVFIYCHNLFNQAEVDLNTLLGAACAYILFGLFFAMAFAVMLHFDPDAILLPDNSFDPMFNLIYFSFVTFTTLGYGDMLPQSTATQMLAAYEAIAGQIFVTFVVAILVGTYVSNRQRR